MLSGEWGIRISGHEAIQNYFPAVVAIDNGRISIETTSKSFSIVSSDVMTDSVRIVVSQYDKRYELKGSIEGGSLSGRWTALESEYQGEWHAERQPQQRSIVSTTNTVVINSSGNNHQADAAGSRSLCRVWVDPFDIMIIDPGIKPL